MMDTLKPFLEYETKQPLPLLSGIYQEVEKLGFGVSGTIDPCAGVKLFKSSREEPFVFKIIGHPQYGIDIDWRRGTISCSALECFLYLHLPVSMVGGVSLELLPFYGFATISREGGKVTPVVKNIYKTIKQPGNRENEMEALVFGYLDPQRYTGIFKGQEEKSSLYCNQSLIAEAALFLETGQNTQSRLDFGSKKDAEKMILTVARDFLLFRYACAEAGVYLNDQDAKDWFWDLEEKRLIPLDLNFGSFFTSKGAEKFIRWAQDSGVFHNTYINSLQNSLANVEPGDGAEWEKKQWLKLLREEQEGIISSMVENGLCKIKSDTEDLVAPEGLSDEEFVKRNFTVQLERMIGPALLLIANNSSVLGVGAFECLRILKQAIEQRTIDFSKTEGLASMISRLNQAIQTL